MAHSVSSDTTGGRCFPEWSWQCLPRPAPPSLYCFPCCLCSGLLISLSYSRVNFTKGRWPSAMWDICPSESVRTFGPTSSVRPRVAQGQVPGVFLPSQHTHWFSGSGCVATATVKSHQWCCLLPPNVFFKHATFQTHDSAAVAARAQARGAVGSPLPGWVGVGEGSLCGLTTIRILCILFFPNF